MVWFRRSALVVLCLLIAASAIVLLRSDPSKLAEANVKQLVVGLNESAAIGVPHDFLMSDKAREAQADLLAKVERGEELTVQESLTYRRVYQAVLQDSQYFLGRFDAELTVLSNHAMAEANNVTGYGIAGNHDHHDLSAHKNFRVMLEALEELTQTTSSWGRIVAANRVQKQLVDLISHIGVMPHTVSVGFEGPGKRWDDDALGAAFESMLQSFKVAQFSTVNSTPYWNAVDQGLEHYVHLILAVQDRIWAGTTPWERRIAGRFLAIQTLPPPVDLNRPLRPRPAAPQ